MKYFYKENLKYLRKKNNLSLDKIEELTGIKRCALHLIEKGKVKNPGVKTLGPIVKMFEVSYDDFIYKDLENDDK